MGASKYLPMFLAECRENLQELNLAVVRLEEAPEEHETVDVIFRVAHSLKGMASAMGFDAMARLTHEMEDVFELLRRRGTAPSGDVVDTVLAVLDALEGAVDAIGAGDGERLAPDALIARLRALVRQSDRDGAPRSRRAQGPSPVLAEIRDGQTVHEVRVTLAADVQMPAVRALQLHGALASQGTVLRSDPAEEALERWSGTVVEVLLATDAPPEAIEAAARSVSDVSAVEIGDPAPAARPQIGPPPGEGSSAGRPFQTVRVDCDRLDALMYGVGELVAQHTLAEALAAQAADARLAGAMRELARSSRALQELIMQIRLVPVDAVFLRFPRVVRDVAARLGKQVDLQLIGNETELDRAIVDAIGDPLVHLVRNSLDHGLETPEERLAAGKPAAGTLTLAARHSGGSIVITVTDDGRGVDPARVARVAAERGLIDPARVTDVGVEDAIELLFAPGFSTADEVGDLSGRGVGLDAVRARLRELGGEITVLSVPGVGTESEIRLPLTLAVVSALLVEVGGRPFGIPVQQVERTLPVAGAAIRSAGPGRVLACDGQELPLVSASVLLGGAGGGPEEQIVVVRGATGSVALCVARIVGEVELVTRPLPAGTVATGAVTGAAALSSGGLVLIADGDALAAAADDGPAQELAA